MKSFLLVLVFTLCGFFASAQKQFSLRGSIYDADTKNLLPTVVVKLADNQSITNSNGFFIFNKIIAGRYSLQLQLQGYESQELIVSLVDKNEDLNIYLEKKATTINEVQLSHHSIESLAKESSATTLVLTQNDLDKNRENTLMQSLQNLPGIQAMGIGVGQSKPMIRGLGFNRVVITQNGIKHEAQQWGSDHGLEIDQNEVGSVEIIKGPASLLYGSEAIGGVINLRPVSVPNKNGFEGNINLLAESNNNLLGTSVGLQGKSNKWSYRARFTLNDYADYNVPVDKIIYENYVFNLSDNNLRNTAGIERDASFSVGFSDSNFKTETFISNYNAKNGFFANAHGLEVRTSAIDYDRSARDVDLPYHTVNHFKVVQNNTLNLDRHEIRLNLGYQNNLREEQTEAVAHGYMPKLEGTLDRRYLKNTFTAELQDEITLSDRHQMILGMNAEYQSNDIDGWGFLIPSYKRFTAGIYAFDNYEIRPDLFLNAGVRYDFGKMKTDEYIDWYPSVAGSSSVFLQRATANRFSFDNASAVAGLSYIRKKINYKINIGKSFRIPLANELSSNGVNYHMFRYEKGNPNLDAETSYQLDAEISYAHQKVSFSLTPYLNYFNNYIYLNPTANYFETLQIYEYTQSKVFRAGGEVSAEYKATESLNIAASAEYVFSRQLSGSKKGFTLPFSPPLRGLFSIDYEFEPIWFFEDLNLKTDLRLSAKQDQIVPPEKSTEGYSVLDVALNMGVKIFKEKKSKIRLKVNNILNTTYFDHLSFYRLIEVPQPGRNASVSIAIPF